MDETNRKFYLVKVDIYTEQENGKIKTDKVEVLVKDARDINEATDVARKNFAETGLLVFKIKGVSESKVTEVLQTPMPVASN